eukprot:1315880-Pleurochrysis_carterae.AAC.1
MPLAWKRKEALSSSCVVASPSGITDGMCAYAGTSRSITYMQICVSQIENQHSSTSSERRDQETTAM